MKTQNMPVGTNAGVVRAGLISLLVPAVCYLWVFQRWDLPRTWLFIISVAVCFVLMLESIVDLLVLMFGFAAKFSGMGVGRSVRFVRRAVKRIAPRNGAGIVG